MWWVDSASTLLQCGQCKQSLLDHATPMTGNGGNSRTIWDRPAQLTRSSPCREEGKQGLLLDRAQNTEPSHNLSIHCFCLEDVEGPVVSAFKLNMILTWLWCWCCYVFSAWWLLGLFVPAYCSWETLSWQWSENKVFWKLSSAVIWWTSYGFFCMEKKRKGGEEREKQQKR